jgi:hypothetical protein
MVKKDKLMIAVVHERINKKDKLKIEIILYSKSKDKIKRRTTILGGLYKVIEDEHEAIYKLHRELNKKNK